MSAFDEKIKRFLHCRACATHVPKGKSARGHMRLEIAIDADGLHVWCTRHDLHVVSLTPDSLAALMVAPPPCHVCGSSEPHEHERGVQ